MSTNSPVQTLLQQRLAQILNRTGKIESELRQLHNPDSQERVVELENDQVLEGLEALGLDEVRQIREALKRLDNGSYGTCASCGRPISAKRLAALPSTATCVKCAKPSIVATKPPAVEPLS